LKLTSEANSLLSICELGDDIRDLVITYHVVIIYCILFYTSLNIENLSNVSRCGPLLNMCSTFTVLSVGPFEWPLLSRCVKLNLVLF